MVKNIKLTFDYELFFGDESGTVLRTLIEPTNKILDAMDSVGANGTFFVDWQMLKYLSLEEDARAKEDYILIVNQLKDIIMRGHRIELHIHPHWVDAKYIGNGKWNFDNFDHYSLQSFREEEIVQMFVEGTNLLESIVKEVDPQYKIVAFRAGGWAILPFDMLKKGFERAGILIDSSIIGGEKVMENDMVLDFTSAPTKAVYRFSKDVLIEDTEGTFIEYQIGQLHFDFFTSVLNSVFHKLYPDRFVRLTDGTHDRKVDNSINITTRLSFKDRVNRKAVISLDAYPPFLLRMLLRKNKEDVVTIMGHPKDFTKSTCVNIKMLGHHYNISNF